VNGVLDAGIASAASLAVAVAVAALGGVFAAFALYQVLLAVAAFLYRGHGGADEPWARIAVLVPAHDEAALIQRCIRSLRGQTYPSELYDLVVIADNCTDDTAALARVAGAKVLVRDEPELRGKGHALRWALERVLAGTPRPDAVAVVDADSVAARDFLSTLAEPLHRGAAAVQGESLIAEDGSPAAAFRAAAFLLVNRVRPAGRAVLGLPCDLSGNGMLFRRELLQAHGWTAFSSTEDVEYTITLRLAGIGPTFAGGAILHSPAAPDAKAAEQQQLRWEGGKLHVARTRIPQIAAMAVRSRRPSLLDAAVELAVPPLGLLVAGTALGIAMAALVAWTTSVAWWALVPWLVALVSIPIYVLVGLRAARAPASAYRALARAPLFVLAKLFRAHRLLTFRSDTWVRTERARDGQGGETQ
jgi:1,2-diacylglycerol 3-beta-glucosyltransferase